MTKAQGVLSAPQLQALDDEQAQDRFMQAMSEHNFRQRATAAVQPTK